MRQIYVLDRSDLAALRRGEQFTITLPGGASVTLQVERKATTKIDKVCGWCKRSNGMHTRKCPYGKRRIK